MREWDSNIYVPYVEKNCGKTRRFLSAVLFHFNFFFQILYCAWRLLDSRAALRQIEIKLNLAHDKCSRGEREAVGAEGGECNELSWRSLHVCHVLVDGVVQIGAACFPRKFER